MVKISVILCTHNPRADYLKQTLAGLEGQSLSKDLWEFLLIDNASDVSRKPSDDLSWHPNGKVILEEELGLTPARLRGIREADGTLLVFVDDDNVLEPDYLERALEIAGDCPFLGSWSGQCFPSFESKPPEWTRRYWGNLVIREFEKDLWSNLPRLNETMPCGAGLCVRREVADHYLHLHESGARDFQFDRTGDSLLSGGDNDLAACACDVGKGVGIMTSLRLTHLIPTGRLSEEYLAKLGEGIYFSAVVLAELRGQKNEVASYVVRWRDRVRVWLLTGPHRKIQRAVLRGRGRGLDFVANRLS